MGSPFYFVCKLLLQQPVAFALEASEKQAVLKEISEKISQYHKNINSKELYEGLLEREAKASTGGDSGVAIPHTTLSSVENTELFLFLSHKGVTFDSLDNDLSFVFFVILSPKNKKNEQMTSLKIIGEICRMMRIEKIREKIIFAKNIQDILNVLECT